MPQENLATVHNLDPGAAHIQKGMEKYGGEQAVINKLGLGLEELKQTVSYGSNQGTMWEMVEASLIPPEDRPKDAKICPLGDELQKAFAAEGMKGVTGFIAGIQALIPDFELAISERTIALASVKPPQKETPEPTKPDLSNVIFLKSDQNRGRQLNPGQS
jgi:hypothetical protein